MQLTPGIHRFEFGLGSAEWLTHIFLLEGPAGSILIDTGLNEPGLFQRLRSEFDSSGVRLQDIRYIVLTHFHPDHIGLAAIFKELSGAAILMHHEGSVARNELYRYGETPSESLQRSWFRQNGVPEPVIRSLMEDEYCQQWLNVMPVPPPDEEIDDGTVISNGRFNLQVIETSGHAKEHVCLYEPTEKLLFSGDHVSSEPAYVGIDPFNTGNPWGDYLASLPKLLNLPIRIVQPGHGKPCTRLAERLQRQVAFREERQQAILDQLCRNPAATYEVARGLSWGPKEDGFDALVDVRKRSSIHEVAADLEFLRRGGKVDRIEQDGSPILWGKGGAIQGLAAARGSKIA